MKKRTTVITICLPLLLLVFSTPQLIDIKAAKADTEAVAVFRSTGGLWWYEQSGWPNEYNVSLYVALYIFGRFYYPPYDVTNYYNAESVTKSTILSMIEYANSDFDYATFFIFVNGVYYTDYDVIYYVQWPYIYAVEYIPVTHYALYTSNENEYVSDIEIGEITYWGSTLHFVFLWSCVQANEIGSYHYSYWIYYPYFWYKGSGAAGMPYAWTHRDYTQMSSDGYASPDSGSYCFISFEGFGMPMSETIPDSGGKNYGDFAKKFYLYALQPGYSIKQALDAASEDVWGPETLFGNTDLYNGYEKYLPGIGTWPGKMRVYGNGNNYLPN